MSDSSTPFDSDAKRWLLLLGVVGIGGVIWLTTIFVNASESHGESLDLAADPGGTTLSSEVPDWGTKVQPTLDEPYFPPLPPPPPTNFIKTPEVVQKEYVQKHAEYLRKMLQDPKTRKAFGGLTVEQVDEMEKKGITVW